MPKRHAHPYYKASVLCHMLPKIKLDLIRVLKARNNYLCKTLFRSYSCIHNLCIVSFSNFVYIIFNSLLKFEF